MKKLILLALLCASPAAAEEHVCQVIGELGETIMTMRQSGAPMSKMMAVLPQIDAQIREVTEIAVRMAYDEPLYSSESYQRRAVVQFRDKVEVLCFKSDLGS